MRGAPLSPDANHRPGLGSPPLHTGRGLTRGLLLPVRPCLGAGDPASRAHHPRSKRPHWHIIGPWVGAQDRRWWHCQHDTSSVARMLPSVIGSIGSLMRLTAIPPIVCRPAGIGECRRDGLPPCRLQPNVVTQIPAARGGSPGISRGGSLAGFGVGSVNGCGGYPANHLEILSASRNQTFTCCHRLPAYLNSSSSGFSRPK
jgi:hypothetical protein